MSQLPLALGGLGPPDFDSYYPGDDALVLARLQGLARSPGADQLLLCGAESSGKTHLLLACCELARALAHRVAYLPLKRLPVEALRETMDADLIAVDDADRAFVDRDWAVALFALINRQHDRRAALLLSAGGNVAQAALPDLASRLARAETLRLAPRDDVQRRAILLHRAAQAGIPLDESAVDYLLRHGARDLRALMDLLARLDREALARGRRITVPLLRELL